ncbi:hypothetical protein EWM64_g5521 [Hericium alpestre]|uniref:Amino acid permease/ SLC12A domain-containing protein n=1 Tax=Hericium alpestre TaxID=135208 RepID=A0A4Y9ZUL6_9AGAM|nr:hypothetical protein EWM64_g5521 [Hericium alpestre]
MAPSDDSTSEKNSAGKHEAYTAPASDHYHGEGHLEGGEPVHRLKRQLKNRHISMISIGAHGGPVGLLLGYLVVGSICYSTMISLGEMISYLPIPGGHIKLAERFVNPALSFTMGWNYWYNWTIVLPAELSAAAVLINFWDKDVNLNAAWVTICLIVVVIINFLGAGAYGEAEFIFASIKVITITGAYGMVSSSSGSCLISEEAPITTVSVSAIGKHPGPFVQYHGISGSEGRFLGWWAVMTGAAFSFIGTEITAIAAGEAKNPRRNLPKAIRRVYVRILLFYVGGVIIIGWLVPSSDPRLVLSSGTAAASPFVIAIQNSGIKVLPHIINACLLTSAWSAASSDMYTSSRALYGLAVSGNAPKIFAKATRNGLPIYALFVSTAFSFLAYMGVKSGSGKVFGWFANMTSVAGLMTWFGIAVTYIRFYAGCKAQGIDRKKLPFSSPLQPYAAYWAAGSTIVICFFSGWSVFLKDNWDTSAFVTNYLPFILFPILYIGSRLWYRTPWVKAEDMDFVSDIAEIEAECYEEPPPRNRWEAFWQWLM